MLGYRHKETTPAGTYYYNEQNKLHRADGPAVEYTTGLSYYYHNGVRISESRFAEIYALIYTHRPNFPQIKSKNTF